MSSGMRFPGGREAQNEADFRGPSRLATGRRRQAPINMLDSQSMNPMMTQSTVDNTSRRVKGIDFNDENSGYEPDNISEGSGQTKKHYHRHTEDQIQKLENFFRKCSHPNEMQRKLLSRDLGLKPLQIKFWFQNKRTQLKMQRERHKNTQIQMDYKKLKAENLRLKEMVKNVSCLRCGGPTAMGDLCAAEHNLHAENARLKDQVDRMAAIVSKCAAGPIRSVSPCGMAKSGGLLASRTGEEQYVAGQPIRRVVAPILEVEKQKIVEVAGVAMEEFLLMAQVVEPLWTSVIINGNTTYVLNEDVYFQAVLRAPSPRWLGFRREATRDLAVVMMNHDDLIKILMNVNQWATFFCGVVAKATQLEILSSGVDGNHDGALQVMKAEFQMMTPIVPSRETCIVRLCKKLDVGIWVVVDVSLEGLQADPAIKFLKRPSGCLIQQMPNGCSKITWIEHMEVQEDRVNSIYGSVINSGAAFSAKHWLSILHGQCIRFACSISREIPPNDVNNIELRRSMLKLGERMGIAFCSSSGSSSDNIWTSLSNRGIDDFEVMTHKSVNRPGYPTGIVITVAASLWLPATSNIVFNYFHNENNRPKWDSLNNGAVIIKVAHITTGKQVGNCISLLQASATSENQNNLLILQESFTCPTYSSIIYSLIDHSFMNIVLDGGNINNIPLIPSGFFILPDSSTGLGHDLGGTIVSMAFQFLVDSSPEAKLSYTDSVIVDIMFDTLHRIKSTFGGLL